MSLRSIVQTLGGDLYDGGRRANIPAPGHSAADRSVSLLLRDERVVVHTFGDGDWRSVLDHLRGLNLIDAANAPLSVSGALERAIRGAGRAAPERRDAALRLWEAGRPVRRTPSERHCRLRGIRRDLPGPEALRHCAEAPVAAYARSRYARPALLAGIQTADGQFTAVEVTYLAANGRRAEGPRRAAARCGWIRSTMRCWWAKGSSPPFRPANGSACPPGRCCRRAISGS